MSKQQMGKIWTEAFNKYLKDCHRKQKRRIRAYSVDYLIWIDADKIPVISQ